MSEKKRRLIRRQPVFCTADMVESLCDVRFIAAALFCRRILPRERPVRYKKHDFFAREVDYG